MRPLFKKLSLNRADWSFGKLVDWHFYKYGTRPDGDPNKSIGEPWKRKRAAAAVGVSARTLRNWINGTHLPNDIADLCKALFGDDNRWHSAKLELEEKFEEALAAARGGTAESPPVAPVDLTPPAEAAPPNDIQATPDPLAAEDEACPTHDESRQEKRPSHHPIVVAPARSLGTTDPPRPLPRWVMPAFFAAVAAALGSYWWLLVRPGERPRSETPQTTQNIPPAKKVTPPTVPQKQAEAPKQPDPPPPTLTPQPEPPTPPKITEASPEPPPLSEEEQAQIKARQEAFDREQKDKDDQAALLDTLDGDPGAEQRQRDAEARQLAGLGYRLRENMSAPVSPFASMLKANVAECAKACDDQSCDGFSFYRSQYGPASRQPRYCYLFRGPFTPSNNPGYVFGERVPDPAAATTPLRKGALSSDAPIVLAQATAPSPDAIVRCSSGPVKVTGFRLACDTILGGGTTLGSTRLSYTVANINECAAKCRPVGACTGFTFNSGDREGQHACMIFGGKPEPRESAGWISGMR